MKIWEIEALTNQPTTSVEHPPEDLVNGFERDYNYIKQAFPMIPKVSTVGSATATYMGTAGTSAVYEHVVRIGESGMPDAQQYSLKYTQYYRDIQEAQQRPARVCQLMTKYASHNTLTRFDSAKNAYSSAKAGIGNHRKAALEMRNLLDGLQGDLFESARLKAKEDMNWDKMTGRLAYGVAMGPEHQELIKQGEVRSTLISRLSDILKDRIPQATNADHLWTQVLDHIHTVLGLLKP